MTETILKQLESSRLSMDEIELVVDILTQFTDEYLSDRFMKTVDDAIERYEEHQKECKAGPDCEGEQLLKKIILELKRKLEQASTALTAKNKLKLFVDHMSDDE